MQEKNPLIRGIAKLELNFARRRRLHLSNVEFFVDLIIAVVAIIAFFIFFKLSIFAVLGWSIITFILCFIIVIVSQTIIGTSHGISHLGNKRRYNESQRVRNIIDSNSYNSYNGNYHLRNYYRK